MKIRLLIAFLILLTILLLLTPTQSFACDPDDIARSACNPWSYLSAPVVATAVTPSPQSFSSPMFITPTATIIAQATATLTPTLTVIARIPRGDSPAEARDVPAEWQALEPRASVWYKTDYSDNFRVLEYWLEINLPDVASFAVYSPNQTDGLSAATKPVGRGTHSKSDPDNLLRWKAGYAWPGIWYVLLTNNTDQPISYKLNHNQETVPVKNCISYWESVQGVPTYWTDCGLHTGPH